VDLSPRADDRGDEKPRWRIVNRPIRINGGCGFAGRQVVQYVLNYGLSECLCVVDNFFTGRNPDLSVSAYEGCHAENTNVNERSLEQYAFSPSKQAWPQEYFHGVCVWRETLTRRSMRSASA